MKNGRLLAFPSKKKVDENAILLLVTFNVHNISFTHIEITVLSIGTVFLKKL
jgi:hypothetical protein